MRNRSNKYDVFSEWEMLKAVRMNTKTKNRNAGCFRNFFALFVTSVLVNENNKNPNIEILNKNLEKSKPKKSALHNKSHIEG